MHTDSRNLHWITSINDAEKTRGGLESKETFRARNISWWKGNKEHEANARKAWYDPFLSCYNIRSYVDETKIVGEVGPGPFGGMLQVCDIPARKKVFIDYVMRDLVDLNYCEWPEDATYVESGAEKIPLSDDSIDVLLSFNSLDHGWNIFDTLRECLRVSKLCFLAFDCRGDDADEIERRKTQGNIEHPQMIRYEDIDVFLKGLDTVTGVRLTSFDMKSCPIAVITKKCKD